MIEPLSSDKRIVYTVQQITVVTYVTKEWIRWPYDWSSWLNRKTLAGVKNCKKEFFAQVWKYNLSLPYLNNVRDLEIVRMHRLILKIPDNWLWVFQLESSYLSWNEHYKKTHISRRKYNNSWTVSTTTVVLFSREGRGVSFGLSCWGGQQLSLKLYRNKSLSRDVGFITDCECSWDISDSAFQ